MNPKEIAIVDYTYHLPPERIAHYPLTERDASKLLIYRDGSIREDIYRQLAVHLPEGAVLIFNNTRVVEARILFQKPTGGRVEIFCLEPPEEYGGVAAAMMQTGMVRWRCLVGGASKWKPGQVLRKTVRRTSEHPVPPPHPSEGTASGDHEVILEARYVQKMEDSFLIELSWSPVTLPFAALLHEVGSIPLPPYLHRSPEASDLERYQTIYARHEGSVAAPTAGLHFTEELFQSLAARHIDRTQVTLHVGAGTFLPVKAATLEQHPMHVEFISVTRETIRELLEASGEKAIIPVGTTSARTIESLYWLGIKVRTNPAITPVDLVVHQWDAYELPSSADAPQALTALLEWMERNERTSLVTRTQLLITPGYGWKMTDALITNFHQPESTLLLLVASLIGKDWKKVYEYALEHDFRFLSYGDGCLLYPAGR